MPNDSNKRLAHAGQSLIRAASTLMRVYAQILFSRSPAIGLLVFCATATSPRACLYGALAASVAGLTAWLLDLDGDAIASGSYGYNALLVGLGISQTFAGGLSTLLLTVIAASATVLVAASLRSSLMRTTELPVLSIPFLVVFHLLLYAAPLAGFAHAAVPVATAVDASNFSSVLPAPAVLFLQSLGSLFFLTRADAGFLVFVALVLQSRIATVLSALAFFVVYLVARNVMVSFDPGLVQMLGYNAMLAAVALGGVWFVPSASSFLFALAGVVVCILFAIGLAPPLARLGAPVLILPFNAAVYLMLLTARQRTRDVHPKAVDFIPGSPEENLGYYRTRIARFKSLHPVRFHLPFRGRWICTQAVDGEHTHKGPWRHGFDFEVWGSDGRAFHAPKGGSQAQLLTASDFYCHRLPVLATALGTVVAIENNVPDNVLGEINTRENWGNLVLIQHGSALYSLVAHLAKGSVKVVVGQVVRAGEVVGLCGNSGRSPQPHLHFQLQATARIGAPTLPCEWNDVVAGEEGLGETLELALEAKRNHVLRNLDVAEEMSAFFTFVQGDTWTLRSVSSSERGERLESIESEVDLYGQLRLCARAASGEPGTTSVLAYSRGEDMFTAYDVIGLPGSMLHVIRAALPRVPLESNSLLVWRDYLPSRPDRSLLGGALADAISPFVALTGLEMEYRMSRESGLLVIRGNSAALDRKGAPLVRTRIELARNLGPLRAELVSRGKRTAFERVLDAAELETRALAS